jgi:ribA/ribD-fused uncharacterized protein
MQPIIQFKDNYEFLSNFYRIPVKWNGTTYKTSEHAFQSAKCELDSDKQKIIDANSPGEAKMLGKKIKMIKEWDFIKTQIMLEIVYEKFKQNLDIKEKLFATGKAYLIEGNYWHDNTWGDCYCPECHEIIGKNALGLILMIVRKNLKNPHEVDIKDFKSSIYK